MFSNSATCAFGYHTWITKRTACLTRGEFQKKSRMFKWTPHARIIVRRKNAGWKELPHEHWKIPSFVSATNVISQHILGKHKKIQTVGKFYQRANSKFRHLVFWIDIVSKNPGTTRASYLAKILRMLQTFEALHNFVDDIFFLFFNLMMLRTNRGRSIHNSE